MIMGMKDTKLQKWTIALAAVGLVSMPVGAEEKPSPILTALSSTTISGYVNTSAIWNPGTGNANLPPYAFNAGKSDGFNLDVAKLTIERPLDEAQWSAGYKVDLLFGPDANALATQSTLTSGSTPSDFGIKQAYVALRAPVGNGLDVKMGVWDTIIGYESFDAGSNPNYTRSYGYTVEPTTHTGVLMSYQVLDSWRVVRHCRHNGPGDQRPLDARGESQDLHGLAGVHRARERWFSGRLNCLRRRH
jgi:hypothetical protein